MIENFKVGVVAKYDLDCDTISQIFPHLIYCSITGFEQDVHDATVDGYDFMIQGMNRRLSVTGETRESGGMTVKVGVALVDILQGQTRQSQF